MREMERYSGTIGVMGMNAVSGRFVKSITNLAVYTQYNFGYEYLDPIYVDYAPCTYHQLARNTLVKEMQGNWLFMTDTDHQFAPDLLLRLLRLSKKHGCKVLSGIYLTKYPPHSPVAGLWTPDKKLVYPIKDWNREKEVLELPGCVGGGCLLVYKEVFDRMTNELNELPFTEYNGLSEDYSFCHRCSRLGIPVYLAPRVESHHLIEHAVSVEDYIAPPKEELAPYAV
jgi:hypothetical protein